MIFDGTLLRRRCWLWLRILLGVGVIGIVALWPVQTRRGVNYQWSSRTIRMYEKAVDFESRDLQTRRLLEDILNDRTPGQVQALTIFQWVREHVRPTPDGFPVIDDHPLYIIVRGYGAPDQRTEAFALLASYAGMPSSKIKLDSPQGTESIVIALTEIHRVVYAFDVVNNVLFTDHGALVSTERLTAQPSLIHAAAGGMQINGVPYEDFFSGGSLNTSFSRMEMQKPWHRLQTEVSKLIGVDALR